MRRRRFLGLLGAASVAGSSVASLSAADGVTSLTVPSTGSLLDDSMDPLTDDSLVAVWAEDAATNRDADWWNNAVYYDSNPIPLVAVDGRVAAFGSTLVADRNLVGENDNVAFYLNVLDSLAGGGTVLWDESHDQYWTLDRFSTLASAARDRGYDLRATGDLEADLAGADAVVVMPPRYDVWDSTADALREFVADGGALLVHDQSDYSDYDQAYRLNPLMDRLGAGIRFNDDQVEDDENNAGNPWEVVTAAFNDSFPFFGGGGGPAPNEPPTAAFSVDPSTVTTGDPVGFDAVDAEDPDGSITRYEWAFGDGATAVGPGVEHAYGSAGEYRVTLTVTDDDGATDEATRSVTVEAPDPPGGDDRVEATVEEVLDGDTVKVRMPDGTTESIRVLGVDTAEKPSNQRYEREEEWEGIGSLDVLGTWGTNATEWAKDQFSPGDAVELAYDPEEGKRDPFDRLLAYIYYDPDGDGSRDALYNERLIREGQARVYGSELVEHDRFWEAEREARSAGRGVWAESDPASSSEFRNDAVDELFVPEAAPVRTDAGAPPDSRVAVTAESSARVEGGEGYAEIPLAAVDEDAGVGMVGGLLIDEGYEEEEGFAVDTSGYGNYPFTTNLVDHLAGTDGAVLIDGGHGQFGSDAALSNEDAAYYQRHLEGFGIEFHQFNDLADSDLSIGRALLVTPPTQDYSAAERDAIRSFNEDGGAVVFVGSAAATGEARRRLNDLASDLGTDLRLGAGAVRDGTNNLNGDETLPATTGFDADLPLFSPYPASGGDGGDGDDGSGGDGAPGSSTETFAGSLSGAGDGATHAYATVTGAPSEVRLALSGPPDADFDLYVTLDGREPSTFDYDRRSWDYGSEEEIVLDGGDVDAATELGILVDAYDGSGSYDLTVEETG